jgi:hypothetical protein
MFLACRGLLAGVASNAPSASGKDRVRPHLVIPDLGDTKYSAIRNLRSSSTICHLSYRRSPLRILCCQLGGGNL